MVTLASKFNIKPLTSELLSNLRHFVFPSNWSEPSVPWDINKYSTNWIKDLWSFLHKEKEYSLFAEWYIIPAVGKLVRLKDAKSVVVPSPGNEELLKILHNKLGCEIYQAGITHDLPITLLASTSPDGICTALSTIEDLGNCNFTQQEATVSLLLN